MCLFNNLKVGVRLALGSGKVLSVDKLSASARNSMAPISGEPV